MTTENTQDNLPKSTKELINVLTERFNTRELHRLVDERVLLEIQITAAESGSQEVQKLAGNLRQHVSEGKNPREFLERYPGHADISIEGFIPSGTIFDTSRILIPGEEIKQISDETEHQTTDQSTLKEKTETNKEPVLPPIQEDITMESQTTEAKNTDDINRKIVILTERYPAVEHFLESQYWTTDETDATKILVTRQANIIALLEHRTKDLGKTFQSDANTFINSTILGNWQKETGLKLGRKIQGRGGLFYTKEEAIDLLDYVESLGERNPLAFRITTSEKYKGRPFKKKLTAGKTTEIPQ